jgi:hypothetical protein
VLAYAPPPPAVAAAQRTVLVGRIVAAGGRYAGATARVRIVLRGETGHRFSAAVTMQTCHGLGGCPRGTVRGTWRALPAEPDTGQQASLAGSGRLTALGAVRARGRANGTGFIARGRPSLRLVMSTAGGSLTVSATGPLERGFTPIL